MASRKMKSLLQPKSFTLRPKRAEEQDGEKVGEESRRRDSKMKVNGWMLIFSVR